MEYFLMQKKEAGIASDSRRRSKMTHEWIEYTSELERSRDCKDKTIMLRITQIYLIGLPKLKPLILNLQLYYEVI